MTSYGDSKVEELIETDYRLAAVLFQAGLDFFKSGNMTLQEACKQFHIDQHRLELRIQFTLESKPAAPQRFGQFTSSQLILYLIHTHHAHSRVTLPMVHYHIRKNEQLYSEEFPHLSVLQTFFDKFRTDFMHHLRQEEEIVFPFIHQLEEALQNGPPAALLELPDIQMASLQAHHSADNEEVEDISRLTSHFRFEPQDPLPYRVLMLELKSLHEDLKAHADLEENLLFARAAVMEKKAKEEIKKLLGLN